MKKLFLFLLLLLISFCGFAQYDSIPVKKHKYNKVASYSSK